MRPAITAREALDIARDLRDDCDDAVATVARWVEAVLGDADTTRYDFLEVTAAGECYVSSPRICAQVANVLPGIDAESMRAVGAYFLRMADEAEAYVEPPETNEP